MGNILANVSKGVTLEHATGNGARPTPSNHKEHTMSHTEIETTETVLQSLFTENTGTHFLDSGGTSGRHWQRNQGRDFTSRENRDTVRFDSYNGKLGIEVSLDAYDWLRERLTFNPELDADFQAFCQADDGEGYQTYSGDIEGMEAYLENRSTHRTGEATTINTYNGEDVLSQTLQFTYWTDDDGEHVLLQVHGGADVRGGYTDARAFDVTGEEYCMFDNARFGLWASADEWVREQDAKDAAQPMLPGIERGATREEMADAFRVHSYDGYDLEECDSGYDVRASCEWVTLEDADIIEFEDHGETVDGETVERWVEKDAEDEDNPRTLEQCRGRGFLCILEDGRAFEPNSGAPMTVGAY